MGIEGLTRRLHMVIEQLEAQEIEVKNLARMQGVPPQSLRNRDGSYVMTPILLAQAQALSALQALESRKRRWRNVDPDDPKRGDHARTS